MTANTSNSGSRVHNTSTGRAPNIPRPGSVVTRIRSAATTIAASAVVKAPITNQNVTLDT